MYVFFFLDMYLAALDLSCSTCNLHCITQDFSLCWKDSSHGSQALEWAGLVAAACRVRCSTPHGVKYPQPGVEPVSPALQGRFLVTEPWGKSLTIFAPVLIQLNLWTCVWVFGAKVVASILPPPTIMNKGGCAKPQGRIYLQLTQKISNPLICPHWRVLQFSWGWIFCKPC